MTTNNLTVFDLFNFVPLNDREKEIFNIDKSIVEELNDKLSSNWFYLGGQIRMNANDLISLDTIEKVREINEKRRIEYGESYNGFEAQSVRHSNKMLEAVENMIIKYNEIMNLRENHKI